MEPGVSHLDGRRSGSMSRHTKAKIDSGLSPKKAIFDALRANATKCPFQLLPRSKAAFLGVDLFCCSSGHAGETSVFRQFKPRSKTVVLIFSAFKV
jgi:hypothetical protein